MSSRKVSIRLTRGGWVLLLLCALITAGAFNAALNMTYLLASLLIAVFLVAVFMPLLSVRGLQCRRSVPEPPHAGESFKARLWLDSARRTTARLIMVEQPLAAKKKKSRGHGVRRLALKVASGDTVSLACDLPPLSRGVHPLAGLRWSSRFPFGVSECTVKDAEDGEVVVYPARGRLHEEMAAGLRPRGAQQGVPTRFGLPGQEFRSVREYRPGDNPRRIHWRSSARLGTLQVREMERERTAPVMVILDSRVPADLSQERQANARETLEPAISFAAETVRMALEEGRGATVIGFFPEPAALTITPGRDAMTALNEALARLNPSTNGDPDLLRRTAEDRGIAAAWKVLGVSPIPETADALRTAFRMYPLEMHITEDPGFASVFTMQEPEASHAT